VIAFGASELVAFTVYGEPQSQGNLRRGARGGLYESNRDLASWKRAVADKAGASGSDLFEGAVRLSARFFLPRPGGHFGTGRNAGMLRPSAPTWPAVKPDVDKLARAVLDALTGTLWRDDKQVVWLEASKHYGEPVRCELEVAPALPFELARTG
jgi:Holliday junction resolvase RusA-like endonuclease